MPFTYRIPINSADQKTPPMFVDGVYMMTSYANFKSNIADACIEAGFVKINVEDTYEFLWAKTSCEPEVEKRCFLSALFCYLSIGSFIYNSKMMEAIFLCVANPFIFVMV